MIQIAGNARKAALKSVVCTRGTTIASPATPLALEAKACLLHCSQTFDVFEASNLSWPKFHCLSSFLFVLVWVVNKLAMLHCYSMFYFILASRLLRDVSGSPQGFAVLRGCDAFVALNV